MKNILRSQIAGVLVILLLSTPLCFGQDSTASNPPTNGFKQTSSGADSLLQEFNVDELEAFQQRFLKETEKLLDEKDKLRQQEIQKLEVFIEANPNNSKLDQILLRLAHLLYEQALEDYETADHEYDQLLSMYREGKILVPPQEPDRDYSRSLTLYQKIIDERPDSDLMDDALYNKGFLLQELGRYEQSFRLFERLLASYPQSPYVPDALMLLAEYYFNPPVNEIEKAIELYKQVLKYKDSPKYDAALYRLGWAYYRLSDYPEAISYFTLLSDDINRVQGLDPKDQYHFPAVQSEAIEYIGLSFIDFGGAQKAADYLQKIGGRQYGLDVLKKIGDSYMDVKEEYAKAIQAYELLLSMYPQTPTAPQIQAKLAEAYLNLEDEQLAYQKRKTLFEKYKSDSEWWQNVEDRTARSEATSLAEKALRENINFLLKNAEETGDKTLYSRAVDDSRKYLTTFPQDSHAVQIHWNMALTLDTKLSRQAEAFDEYIKLSNLYWSSEFQNQAAKNAIAIADEAVKKDSLTASSAAVSRIRNLALEDSMRQQYREEELSASEKRLAFALDNYAKLFPHEPETAKMLSRAGALHYEHHQFQKSIKYYKTLVKHFPNSSEATYAQYITMESYFGKSDYRSSEIMAKKLRKIAPEYSVKANKRLAEAIFLTAKTYSDSSQYLAAAEEYKRMVTEVPGAEFADLALYNAALEYKRAGDYQNAVNTYQKLIAGYPKSKHYLSALNNLAFDHRELGQYEEAGRTFEKLAELETEEQDAQNALYNASISFVEAENWQHAIEVNRKFVQRFPTAEEADDLLFNNANYYLKLNQIDAANAIYAEFANKYPDSPRVVEAYYHRGMYFLTNARKAEAGTEFNKAIAKNGDLDKAGKESNDFYAAEALFQLTEMKFDEFTSIRFKLPPQNLAENKQRKKALLIELVDNYTQVAGYGTIRLYEATYRIGDVYEEFARTWAEQEIAETDENKRLVAQKEISAASAELFEEAIDAYKKSVNVLTKFADSYSKKSTDEKAEVSEKIATEDSTLLVAQKWLAESKSKISENLYNIAEIQSESVEQLLAASAPPGMQELEKLVYRNQVLEKIVSPTLQDIIAAHERNIKESRDLQLQNKWVELSKEKLVTASNTMPDELQKLARKALKNYAGKIAPYIGLIEKGDESAYDLGYQMADFLDLSRSTMKSASEGYAHNLQKFQAMNIELPVVDATEITLLQSIYEFANRADSLANYVNAQRKVFEARFQESGNSNFEDAMFTFDENYFALADGAREMFEYGFQISQDLSISNKWSRKLILALVKKDPQQYAKNLGLQLHTEIIPSSSGWLASSEFEEGWMSPGFEDSLWSNAHYQGPSEQLAANGANSIWLVNLDKSKISSADSIRMVQEAVVENSLPSNALSDVLDWPQTVYFRKTFQIAGLPVSGIVQIYGDDSFDLYLNGQHVTRFGADSGGEAGLQTVKIIDYLNSGENVLAVEVRDSDKSRGRLEASLEIQNIPNWLQIQKEVEEYDKTNSNNIHHEQNIDENNEQNEQ